VNDPFASFMAHWIPTLGNEEAFAAWVAKDEERTAAYVLPDFEPFKDTTGKVITGRRAWREHLAATGAVELGHSDLEKSRDSWTKRKAGLQARRDAASAVAPAVDPKDARPVAPSDAARRVMARLHGRPAPDRKTLIQIAIEERRR
jgi:hypothetical protein